MTNTEYAIELAPGVTTSLSMELDASGSRDGSPVVCVEFKTAVLNEHMATCKALAEAALAASADSEAEQSAWPRVIPGGDQSAASAVNIAVGSGRALRAFEFRPDGGYVSEGLLVVESFVARSGVSPRAAGNHQLYELRPTFEGFDPRQGIPCVNVRHQRPPGAVGRSARFGLLPDPEEVAAEITGDLTRILEDLTRPNQQRPSAADGLPNAFQTPVFQRVFSELVSPSSGS